MAELTYKQKAFVDAYLDCLNASEAARRAGYSLRTARSVGSENLAKPDIAAAIQAGMAERAMPRDEVLLRLTEHARADVRDLFEFDESGKMTKLKLTRDAPLHLVKSITPTTKGLKVELHDAQAALIQLGKHYKLWTDVQEVSGSLTVKGYATKDADPDAWDDTTDE